MRAKKIVPAALPPIEDDPVADRPRVDTMAVADAAERDERSLSAARKIRSTARDDVIEGRRLIEVHTHQLFDPVGSDRVDLDTPVEDDVSDLKNSLLQNGQQIPVIVRPRDPRWTPSSSDPADVSGVEFEVLAGRRRRRAIEEINAGRDPDRRITLKARIEWISPESTEAERELHALQHRYTENAARKNLTAYQSAMTGGRLIAAYQAAGLLDKEIEQRLGITHPTRQLWRKAFDQSAEIRKHFAGKEPSHREIKAFVDRGSRPARPAPTQSEKTVGARGVLTTKPSRSTGQVSVNLKLTLDEVADRELLEQLRKAVGQPQ